MFDRPNVSKAAWHMILTCTSEVPDVPMDLKVLLVLDLALQACHDQMYAACLERRFASGIVPLVWGWLNSRTESATGLDNYKTIRYPLKS